MDIAEFINKFNKTKVDYDGVYGAQCVDLFRKYSEDVLGIPEHTGSVEGAKELYIKYDDLPIEKFYFKKLKPTDKAQSGDIVVYNSTNSNKYGHVAIVVAVMPDKKLLIMEQDGFKLDGAKLSIRSTENILGYLRGNK